MPHPRGDANILLPAIGTAIIVFPLFQALVVIGLLIAGSERAVAEQRVALVIGNATYDQSPLRNPVNDARAIAATLPRLGFKVIQRENTTKLQMERAIADFGESLREGDVGLFFYAGHGMQVDGRNYLVPVDARIATQQRVRLETVDVDVVMEQMAAAGTRISLVILDACRDNPFERRFRSGAGGLAQMSAPTGTLIAYATAPGRTAADGSGDNGLYTAELLKTIEAPGLAVEEVFKRVRVEVARASNGAQTPWEASSLTGSFYFSPPAATAAIVAPSPVAPPPSATDREALFWQSVRDSGNPGDFEAYLQRYPEGEFAPLARSRIEALKRPTAVAAAKPAPEVTITRQPPPAATGVDPIVDPEDRRLTARAQARVRDRPSPDARPVAYVMPGEKVHAIGKVRDAPWYLIERSGKPVGYVPAEILE